MKKILLLSLLTIIAMANKEVVMKTSLGTMKFELYTDDPRLKKTTTNFANLIQIRYYEGVKFHRVIKNFMIQGGDPTGTGRGGRSSYGKPFEDEIVPELKFDKPGILAMANAGPNTNGSQFFITTKASPWLNGKHTIFGKLIEGKDVLYKIANVKVGEKDAPIRAVIINSIRVFDIEKPKESIKRNKNLKTKVKIKEKEKMAREF